MGLHNQACFMSYMGHWCMDYTMLSQMENLIRSDLISKMEMRRNSSEGVRSFEMIDGGIAVLHINGMMMKKTSKFGGTSTISLRKMLSDATQDPKVKGILQMFDTGGGHSNGTEEYSSAVEAANKIKPVFSHCEGYMCSAGYWGGANSSQISATPASTIGSLGTYAAVVDSSKAHEMAGVKVIKLATGDYKGAGMEGTEITEKQIKNFQEHINDLNDQFKNDVAKARDFDNKKADELFDGRAFIAEKALKKGLIDKVQSYEATVHDLLEKIASVRSKANSTASRRLDLHSRKLY